jgi:hypothetical protein
LHPSDAVRINAPLPDAPAFDGLGSPYAPRVCQQLLKDRTMPRIRLSFTEQRRRRLALKFDRLDRLEPRSTVTPFAAFSLATGAFQSLVQLGMIPSGGGGNALELVPTLRVGMPFSTLRVVWAPIAAGNRAGRRASRTAFPRRAWE